jgi:hypothetical protein
MPAIESSNVVPTHTGEKLEGRRALPVQKPSLKEENKPGPSDTIETKSNATPTLQSLNQQYGPYVLNRGTSKIYSISDRSGEPLRFLRDTWRDSGEVWMEVGAIDKETLQKDLGKPSAKLEPVPQEFHKELDKAAEDYANVPEDELGDEGPGEIADISEGLDKFICSHLHLISPSQTFYPIRAQSDPQGSVAEA